MVKAMQIGDFLIVASMNDIGVIVVFAILTALVPNCGATEVAGLSPRPVVAAYVMVDNVPSTIRVVVRSNSTRAAGRILLRLTDPEEHVVLWRYVEFTEREPSMQESLDGQIQLFSPRNNIKKGELLLKASFNTKLAGEYQVRVVASEIDTVVDIDGDGFKDFGVSGNNGDFLGWEGLGKEAFAYVPPRAELLKIRGAGIAIYDENDTLLGETREARMLELRSKGSTIWRVVLTSGEWRIRSAGFPLILCPSAEAAGRIRASVNVLADGTVVAHKFQTRIDSAVSKALQFAQSAGTVPKGLSRRSLWPEDPQRNVLLTDGFLIAVEESIRNQNLDPTSHWSGSLLGWKDFEKRSGPDGRWDRMREIPGLWAGASSDKGMAAFLMALAATTPSPANPYFGRTDLLYRAAAAALRDLSVLAEDETWPGIADLDPYPGFMAFPSGRKTFPVFALVAPSMPDEIRNVWAEGLRRIVDRHIAERLVSARNQSAHYLLAFEAFAVGSEDPLYRAMADVYFGRWESSIRPAGYFEEEGGPDTSYAGITHWMQAMSYRLSGRRALLELLKRNYAFFNHTVAPEPDGRMLGGFSFNNRVGDGFPHEQYRGARGIVDEFVPEVAAWREPPDEKGNLHRIGNYLKARIKPGYPDLSGPRFAYFAPEVPVQADFPALESTDFIRNLGDELIAVKQPGYYTYVRVGSVRNWPADRRRREDLRRPRASTEMRSTSVPQEIKRVAAFGGGGLAGFWLPNYGHGLLATNSSPLNHHGLVSTARDGRWHWEDYSSGTFTLDEQAARLDIAGRLENYPLKYVRTYWFKPYKVQVELALHAEKALEMQALIENIPVAVGPWKPYGVSFRLDGNDMDNGVARDITVKDSRGEGFTVRFAQKADIRLARSKRTGPGWRQLEIGGIEVTLPKQMDAGETYTLKYEIAPVVP